MLSIRIIRPHSTWHAPKEYFDMFPLDAFEPPPYIENYQEDLAEELHFQYYWPKKLRFFKLLDAYLGDEGWRRFVRRYFACVAFADTQIGSVIDALEKNNMQKTQLW